MVMPHFDGVALARALKHIDPTVPIIASSGHTDDSRFAALVALGVRDFLTKPYQAGKLLSVLREALAAGK